MNKNIIKIILKPITIFDVQPINVYMGKYLTKKTITIEKKLNIIPAEDKTKKTLSKFPHNKST